MYILSHKHHLNVFTLESKSRISNFAECLIRPSDIKAMYLVIYRPKVIHLIIST